MLRLSTDHSLDFSDAMKRFVCFLSEVKSSCHVTARCRLRGNTLQCSLSVHGKLLILFIQNAYRKYKVCPIKGCHSNPQKKIVESPNCIPPKPDLEGEGE